MLTRIHRDALKLFGAASFGYAVAFLVSPLLTRLYSPAEFGVYVVFGAVAFCDVVACLGFDRAIAVAGENGQANRLFVIACLAALTVAIAYVVATALASDRGLVPTWFVWSVPAYVGAYGLVQALAGLAIRRNGVATIATARMLQALTTPSLQVALGFGPKGAASLAAGQIGSYVIGAIAYLLKGSAVRAQPAGGTASLVATARQFGNFPRSWVPATLLNSINQQLPLFAISALFGTHAGGLYGFGQRVIGAGVGLVCMAVSQAYFVHAAAALRTGGSLVQLRGQIFAIVRSQALLVAPFVLVLLFSPMWVAAVFGTQWQGAALYFQLMALPFAAQLCISPVHVLIDAMQEPRLHLSRELLRLALTASVFVVPLVSATEISTVLLGYAAGVCASYLFGLYRIVAALDGRIRQAAGQRADGVG